MSLHFSAIGFIPECFGDLNDEKTVICNTSSHSQSIVGATYSINGINSGDGECVCLCVRAGVCGSGACGLVYVCMCMLECVSVCVYAVSWFLLMVTACYISYSHFPICYWSGGPE